MKTTWKRPKHRQALGYFILCCLGAIAYSAIFCAWPERPALNSSFLFPVLMVALCLLFACFFGYRAFCFSDDWFRSKEARQADWWDNHPRFRFFSSVAIWSCFIIFMLYQVWRQFHKH